MNSTDPATYFTIVYFLLTMCIVFPSKEFVAAGVTIDNIFSSFLGSEELRFCQYHIKRTAITAFIHACIPLGYFIGCAIIEPETYLPWNITSKLLQLCFPISLIIPIAVAALVFFWSRKRWSNHPIAKSLAAHVEQAHHPWYTVSSSINIEFRRVDKFCSTVGAYKTYVTDSWVLKISTYNVNIAHQRDIHLTLSATEDYALHHETYTGVQFLNIQVESINPLVKPFSIRLNALEYKDLKDKVGKPIRNARNVIIHQTLSDRFLQPFTDQVDRNRPYRLPPNTTLEPCIGCMQQEADMKLQKLCVDEQGVESCVQCYCRPMWCLACMSKWFASRQDQSRPDNWLACKAPCPTCRAKFCMLDVCRVVPL